MIRAPACLALLAAAVPAAAQTPDRDYRASGSEPFWSLHMDGRRMTFTDNGVRTVVAQPGPVGLNRSRRYFTQRLSVIITPGPCEDEGMRRHAETVRVLARGRTYEGCGGGILAPEELSLTSWRILSIGAADVSGTDGYSIDFDNGRWTGRAGCNQLSGTYSQDAGRLTFGPVRATRMACPAPRIAHERALSAILEAGARISFPTRVNNDPPVMVLTSSAGTMRLQLI